MEIPDSWVILKLPHNIYKVFAFFYGGYLGSDYWKLNSGITKIEQDDEYYYFMGYSGSVYKCHKKAYGVSQSFGLSDLNEILKQGKGLIELMDDSENFEKLEL